MSGPQPGLKSIRVDVTSSCFGVINQYAEMRGMTSSQVLFLSLRFNLYREALERPEVRRLFDEAGIDFDPQVVKRIEQSKTIEEVFKPIPEEAFKGKNVCLARMAGRYLFDAPKSTADAVWRITSTVMLACCLALGYGIVARPSLVRAVIGAETIRQDSIEHRLLGILENQGVK